MDLRYHHEMIDSFTLANEAVTKLNTDSQAPEQRTVGSPHVTRREARKEDSNKTGGIVCYESDL